MHGVVVIVDVALLSLYSVMTLLEMLLWGEAPALYHLAAEGKMPLIASPQISFPGSCAQAQLCFTRLTLTDPIFSLLLIAAHPAHPEPGARACCPTCSAFASQTDACVLFRLRIQPCLRAPLALKWRDFCPNKWKSPPS